jgi:hypothetical protein
MQLGKNLLKAVQTDQKQSVGSGSKTYGHGPNLRVRRIELGINGNALCDTTVSLLDTRQGRLQTTFPLQKHQTSVKVWLDMKRTPTNRQHLQTPAALGRH